jgi:hypothetical protein
MDAPSMRASATAEVETLVGKRQAIEPSCDPVDAVVNCLQLPLGDGPAGGCLVKTFERHLPRVSSPRLVSTAAWSRPSSRALATPVSPFKAEPRLGAREWLRLASLRFRYPVVAPRHLGLVS